MTSTLHLPCFYLFFLVCQLASGKISFAFVFTTVNEPILNQLFFAKDMRRCLARRFVPGGSSGGFNTSGTDGRKAADDAFNSLLSKAPLAYNKGTDRYDGDYTALRGQGMDPAMLRKVEDIMSMIPNHIRSDLRSQMASGAGPKMGMMAFGLGENEKGKKVARAAAMVRDPVTGEVKREFVEQQLEPDDPLLPREPVGNYDTSGAVEVEFEEDRKKIQPNEIEVETQDVTPPRR